MAITFGPVDGIPTPAVRERQFEAATHGGGSGRRLGGRSGFRVDTPSNVLTATASTWTLGPCAAMIDPGWGTHQGMYGWASDTNESGPLDPPDENNPRKDVLFIQVNDDPVDGSGQVNAELVYLAGNPSPTPTEPYADGFLVGVISVPVLGGGNPTVSMNPAKYVAAGAPLPVSSVDERDAIPDKYSGLIVQRRDLGGRPLQVWDGTEWKPLGTERTLATTSDGTWAYNVTLTRSWNADGTRSVSMGMIVARTGGGAFNVNAGAWSPIFAGLIPAGWRPTDNVLTTGGYEFNGVGSILVKVKMDGGVEMAGVTGAVSMGTPTKVTASAHWTAA